MKTKGWGFSYAPGYLMHQGFLTVRSLVKNFVIQDTSEHNGISIKWAKFVNEDSGENLITYDPSELLGNDDSHRLTMLHVNHKLSSFTINDTTSSPETHIQFIQGKTSKNTFRELDINTITSSKIKFRKTKTRGQ